MGNSYGSYGGSYGGKTDSMLIVTDVNGEPTILLRRRLWTQSGWKLESHESQRQLRVEQ